MKEKGLLKDSWENFEEYLCSAALFVMTFVTFTNVFLRKTIWFSMPFTQEPMATMFVRACCLAAAGVFKTDFHMGFNYLTDKLIGTKYRVYRICRLLLYSANHGIWIMWGAQMVYRQCHYHPSTGILEMSQWTIGITTPLSAVFSIARMVQYKIRLTKEGN